MIDVTIRNVPKSVRKVLRKSARRNYRSLNGEILAILRYHAERERHRRAAGMTIRELGKMGERIARKYPNAPDSVELIREDRDSR